MRKVSPTADRLSLMEIAMYLCVWCVGLMHNYQPGITPKLLVECFVTELFIQAWLESNFLHVKNSLTWLWRHFQRFAVDFPLSSLLIDKLIDTLLLKLHFMPSFARKWKSSASYQCQPKLTIWLGSIRNGVKCWRDFILTNFICSLVLRFKFDTRLASKLKFWCWKCST